MLSDENQKVLIILVSVITGFIAVRPLIIIIPLIWAATKSSARYLTKLYRDVQEKRRVRGITKGRRRRRKCLR